MEVLKLGFRFRGRKLNITSVYHLERDKKAFPSLFALYSSVVSLVRSVDSRFELGSMGIRGEPASRAHTEVQTASSVWIRVESSGKAGDLKTRSSDRLSS